MQDEILFSSKLFMMYRFLLGFKIVNEIFLIVWSASMYRDYLNELMS
jgi:hypothetical protein